MRTNRAKAAAKILAAGAAKVTRSRAWFKSYGHGAFTKPMEVRLCDELCRLGFETERGGKRADELLGGDAVRRALLSMKSAGWPGAPQKWKIDAIEISGPTFVEVKLAKFDRIRGGAPRYGKCLHDIGPWAKDLDRLRRIRANVQNADCWLLIVAFWKHERDRDTFESFKLKLSSELRNDLDRARKSELRESWPYRRIQARLLRRLRSIDRESCIVLNGKRYGVIGIPAP